MIVNYKLLIRLRNALVFHCVTYNLLVAIDNAVSTVLTFASFDHYTSATMCIYGTYNVRMSTCARTRPVK